MPIFFFKTTLPALKQNTTERIEARIQAQEVGVISLVRLSQGDSFWGKLEGDRQQYIRAYIQYHCQAPCKPVEGLVGGTGETQSDSTATNGASIECSCSQVCFITLNLYTKWCEDVKNASQLLPCLQSLSTYSSLHHTIHRCYNSWSRMEQCCGPWRNSPKLPSAGVLMSYV